MMYIIRFKTCINGWKYQISHLKMDFKSDNQLILAIFNKIRNLEETQKRKLKERSFMKK